MSREPVPQSPARCRLVMRLECCTYIHAVKLMLRSGKWTRPVLWRVHAFTRAQTLFDRVDPNDPDTFAGMDKSMVSRILKLRAAKV